jgi:putative heme iron utilization protein
MSSNDRLGFGDETGTEPMRPDDVANARRLVASAKTATLSTLSSRDDGSPPYPFGSLVALATDDRGVPLLLLSSLAEHTKNLASCPRASLLVAETISDDPLAHARVTLLGEVIRARDVELPSVRDAYLAHHPEARAWAGFSDFAFYTMSITEIRWVAGFGKMGWVAITDYFAR